MKLLRTDNTNGAFKELVRALDNELALRDGDDHDFYHQFNGIESIPYVVVAFLDGEAVGCGAIKPFDSEKVEIKRMYTPSEHRGKGVAKSVMKALEEWAADLNYNYCILETGINQPEAIGLYKKLGFQPIDNYGQYAGISTSYCFQKKV